MVTKVQLTKICVIFVNPKPKINFLNPYSKSVILLFLVAFDFWMDAVAMRDEERFEISEVCFQNTKNRLSRYRGE